VLYQMFNQKIGIKRIERVTDGRGGWNNEYKLIDTVHGFVKSVAVRNPHGISEHREQFIPFVDVTIRDKPNMNIQKDDILVINGINYTIANGRLPDKVAGYIRLRCSRYAV